MKLKKLIEGLDTPKKTTNEKAAFLQEIKKFNEYGSVIYRTEGLALEIDLVSYHLLVACSYLYTD